MCNILLCRPVQLRAARDGSVTEGALTFRDVVSPDWCFDRQYTRVLGARGTDCTVSIFIFANERARRGLPIELVELCLILCVLARFSSHHRISPDVDAQTRSSSGHRANHIIRTELESLWIMGAESPCIHCPSLPTLSPSHPRKSRCGRLKL